MVDAVFTVFCATEAVGQQLSIDMYHDDPPTTSTCIELIIPDAVQYGTELQIDGWAWNGSVNALVYDVEEGSGMFEMTDCSLPMINMSYDLGLPVGTYDMTFIDWVDDYSCSLLVEHTIVVQNAITELNFSSLAEVAVRGVTEVIFAVWMVGGSDVDVSVDWGDGGVLSVSCVTGSELTVVIFYYTYNTTGTFTVSALAGNYLSSYLKENMTITVYEPVHDLYLYGNESLLAPPGTGTWTLVAGPDQLPLENIVCVWDMGANYANTSYPVAMLNTSVSMHMSFSYGQADAGTQTIVVLCSNPVSSQNLTMDVEVIWDSVILGNLTCNSSTLWNHPIICQLTILRFGTGACFEWDMGDGQLIVYYQDAYCAAAVPTASPTYLQV